MRSRKFINKVQVVVLEILQIDLNYWNINYVKHIKFCKTERKLTNSPISAHFLLAVTSRGKSCSKPSLLSRTSSFGTCISLVKISCWLLPLMRYPFEMSVTHTKQINRNIKLVRDILCSNLCEALITVSDWCRVDGRQSIYVPQILLYTRINALALCSQILCWTPFQIFHTTGWYFLFCSSVYYHIKKEI